VNANASKPPLRVLFVCLGNICRSPTAEALFRQRVAGRGLGDRFAATSAGVIARGNDVAALDAVEVADAHGVDMHRHLSTPLTEELIRAHDLVVAMDRMIAQHVLNLVPDLGTRLQLLMRFAPDDSELDVPDPIGQPRSVFEESYRMMEAGVDGLLEALVEPDDAGGSASADAAPDGDAGESGETG
jgi:protein-tyrosine phosphatase